MTHIKPINQTTRIYSWNAFDKDVKLVLEYIKQRKLKIKCVYGIPKGGLILAVTLANKLSVPLISNFDDFNDKHKDIKSEEILVVDDISDSGKTLSFLPGIDTYNIITLFIKEGTMFIPDFYCNKEKTKWVVFPWE